MKADLQANRKPRSSRKTMLTGNRFELRGGSSLSPEVECQANAAERGNITGLLQIPVLGAAPNGTPGMVVDRVRSVSPELSSSTPEPVLPTAVFPRLTS